MENNTHLKNITEMYKGQSFHWIDNKSNESVKSHLEVSYGSTLRLNKATKCDLEFFQLTKFLLSAYEDFQKVAVGIDHGIAYSKIHNQVMVGSEPWDHVLSDASHQLRLVLTEIQTALMEMNVTIEKNVYRDIIPSNLTLTDNTDVGLYNAIVYRHYFKFLSDFKEMLNTTVERLQRQL